jgi:putative acetyltransferase
MRGRHTDNRAMSEIRFNNVSKCAERKGPLDIEEYKGVKNRRTIDGIDGLRSAGPRRRMRASDQRIRSAIGEGADLGHARHLFRFYDKQFADSIAESLCVQGFDAQVAGLRGRYAPRSGCMRLSLDGERPIGRMAMRDLGCGTCEMKRRYVAPERRGRGIGRRLVGEILGVAESTGYRSMVLGTLPEMDRAIALYRSFGFAEIVGYWDNLGERTIYFEKRLVC